MCTAGFGIQRTASAGISLTGGSSDLNDRTGTVRKGQQEITVTLRLVCHYSCPETVFPLKTPVSLFKLLHGETFLFEE